MRMRKILTQAGEKSFNLGSLGCDAVLETPPIQPPFAGYAKVWLDLGFKAMTFGHDLIKHTGLLRKNAKIPASTTGKPKLWIYQSRWFAVRFVLSYLNSRIAPL